VPPRSAGGSHRTSGIASEWLRLEPQNPVQYWQLRSGLSVEQAAQRVGISADRYRAVVVFGKVRCTEEEIQQVLAATSVAGDMLRAWEQRLRGDAR
jgi:hypothetical protein